MKIRELLQTEIWNKEASRNVLANVMRVFLRVGIVFGILVVVLGVTFAIEVRWLTSGERKVARAAMAEIDAMQNLVQASSGDFEEKDKHAKQMVEAADRTAKTIRDGRAASSVAFYLLQTEDARRESEFLTSMHKGTSESSAAVQNLKKKWDGSNLQMRVEARSLVLNSLQ
jgi:hypothetical protein